MSKKDLIAINIVGFASGLLAIPILTNLNIGIGGPLGHVGFILFVAGSANATLWFFYKLSAWKPIFRQLAKFASVGVLNTLIDFGILNALSFVFQVFSGGTIALFNATGFIIATINSYFWNKHWTFESSNKKKLTEFLQFFVVSVIGIVINTGIVFTLTTHVAPLGGITEPQWENAAKLLATVVSLVWNFIGYKFIVFKGKG